MEQLLGRTLLSPPHRPLDLVMLGSPPCAPQVATNFSMEKLLGRQRMQVLEATA